MTTVRGSIEFRDAVFTLAKGGRPVYMRMAGRLHPAYRVIGGDNPSNRIELEHLFQQPCPPVQMEDAAQAMVRADRAGFEVPVIELGNDPAFGAGE